MLLKTSSQVWAISTKAFNTTARTKTPIIHSKAPAETVCPTGDSTVFFFLTQCSSRLVALSVNATVSQGSWGRTSLYPEKTTSATSKWNTWTGVQHSPMKPLIARFQQKPSIDMLVAMLISQRNSINIHLTTKFGSVRLCETATCSYVSWING